MYQSREANAPSLPCPYCRPGRDEDPAAEPGKWNLCPDPDCDSLWRKPSAPAAVGDANTAEKRYWKAYRQAGRVWRQLERRRNTPRGRWTILARLAGLTDEMAAAAAVWDNDRTDSYGFTPHEWMTAEAQLLRMVMHTERALARGELTYGQRLDREPSLAGPMGIDDHVTDVLWRLSDEPDVAAREDLVDELYEAVVRHVGGQAAETLASVAGCYRKAAQTGWRRFLPWL